MTDKKTAVSENNNSQNALKKKTSIFSIVWLIPIVALIAGIVLLIGKIQSTGPEIVLHMQNAEGIEAGKTFVKVLDVEVGRVSEVTLSPDSKGVKLIVKMNSSVTHLITENTSFWVVKPRIDQTGITGLTTLVSGVYIEMLPSDKGEKQLEFEVSNNPSSLSGQIKGKRILLEGEGQNLFSVGTPILYHSIPVGIIEQASFNTQTKKVNYQIFINQPNDQLLGDQVKFWVASTINVETTAKGFNVSNLPIGVILTGAIEFSEFELNGRGNDINDNAVFTLYPSKKDIPQYNDHEVIKLIAYFNQSIRSLPVGATVEYKGIKVGEVMSVPYFIGNDKANLFEDKLIPIMLHINPRLLDNDKKLDLKVWEERIQAAMKNGLVANLATDSLITGMQYIELTEKVKNEVLVQPKQSYGNYAVLATRTTGLDELQSSLARLLEKFNQLPLEKTVAELNATMAGLNQLLNDSETKQLPQELKQTLQELQNTLQGISKDSPLYTDVQKTMNNLNKTLQNAEPVLRTLNEKPNALIFNHQFVDPVPQGSK